MSFFCCFKTYKESTKNSLLLLSSHSNLSLGFSPRKSTSMRASTVLASLLTIVSASPQLDRRACSHDNCLRAFIGSSATAATFCATYTTSVLTATIGLPTYATQCSNLPSRVSTACSCLFTAVASTSSSSSSSSSTSSTSSSPSTCTATEYSQIAPAVAACTAITLQDIAVPTNSSINLASLKANSVVTFAGLTTFAFTNSSTFNPMTFGGKNVTITSAPGAIIDGNGPAYWDGQGSNGGVPKYVSFKA